MIALKHRVKICSFRHLAHLWLVWVIGIPLASHGQGIAIPGFSRKVPNPFILSNGSMVASPEQWYAERRPELLHLFTTQMYGRSPGRPPHMLFHVFDDDPHALDGMATRRQVAVFLNGKKEGPRIDILIYLPNAARKAVPLFIGLNFAGNQSIAMDTAIRITASWEYGGNKGGVDRHTTVADGGLQQYDGHSK